MLVNVLIELSLVITLIGSVIAAVIADNINEVAQYITLFTTALIVLHAMRPHDTDWYLVLDIIDVLFSNNRRCYTRHYRYW
jgi:uncharacterized Tic20 family protein